MERNWPGNIRELRHTLERAFVFCENNRLRVADFDDAKDNAAAQSVSRGKPDPVAAGTLKGSLDQYERELMADAMIKFNGNKRKRLLNFWCVSKLSVQEAR